MVFCRRDFFVFIEGEVNDWDMVGWDYVSSGLSVHQMKKRFCIPWQSTIPIEVLQDMLLKSLPLPLR